MSNRKFGKQIQKRQLEVPEYAASFVNYKALKKVCSITGLGHGRLASHSLSGRVRDRENNRFNSSLSRNTYGRHEIVADMCEGCGVV